MVDNHSNNHPFRARLRVPRPIIADGAMGTQLYAQGVPYDKCFDARNIDRPDLVERIHLAYLRAGAELIETNTFGANRFRLGTFGLADSVKEINRSGARVARGAREIFGEPAFVAGSIGPTGRTLEPYGNTRADEIYDAYREQILALLEGGVDLLMFETFGDVAEITAAIRAARDTTDLPIVAMMTFTEDLQTLRGSTPRQTVEALAPLGVDALGANCSVGSSGILQVVELLLAAGAGPVAAMPNAGLPMQVGSRFIYLSSPEYMAEYGRRMVDAGARIVGGCCGTTPDHIRALCAAVSQPGPTRASVEFIAPTELEAEPSPERDESSIAAKLGTRRVISVEIRPPRGANPGKALAGARLLKEAGVDAVNVLDSAMSRVRMSAVATATLIRAQVGVETILHFTTRDRNLMAIQSDLIGAHAMGIRAVLALTGDPPSVGDYAQSRAVYDVDSIGLLRIIKQLNQGHDIGGNSIGTPTRFLAGCALNPTAEDLDWELDRFHQKVEAGADFVMTQPVYDAELFHRVLTRVGPIHVPILMGLLPLQSYRHALFLHNELPGVRLTPDALARMERAGIDGIPEGLRMAEEMIDACGGLVAGMYIMPSFGRYENAALLVSRLLTPA